MDGCVCKYICVYAWMCVDVWYLLYVCMYASKIQKQHTPEHLENSDFKWLCMALTPTVSSGSVDLPSLGE